MIQSIKFVTKKTMTTMTKRTKPTMTTMRTTKMVWNCSHLLFVAFLLPFLLISNLDDKDGDDEETTIPEIIADKGSEGEDDSEDDKDGMELQSSIASCIFTTFSFNFKPR